MSYVLLSPFPKNRLAGLLTPWHIVAGLDNVFSPLLISSESSLSSERLSLCRVDIVGFVWIGDDWNHSREESNHKQSLTRLELSVDAEPVRVMENDPIHSTFILKFFYTVT
jgi:hypothetical protein